MVTTRSADKRIDSSRGEDLVLRSRTVQSPCSSTPAPSQLRKRGIREHGQSTSPRAKRQRTGLDGAGDEEDVTQDSIEVSRGEIPDASNMAGRARNGSNFTPEQELRERTYLPNEANSIPAAKSPSRRAAASSATKSDFFTTPATSKHKHYSSEELDEDTIVINQSTDSSAHNGYHTADEEFEESNDAPEIASTKMPLAAPHRKSIRAPRSKKLARASIARNELAAGERSIEPQPVPRSISRPGAAKLLPDPALDVLDENPDTIAVKVDVSAEISESRDPPVLTNEHATNEVDKIMDNQSVELSDALIAPSDSHISPQPQSPATPSSSKHSMLSVSLQQRTVFPSSNTTTDLSLSKATKYQLSRNTYPVPSTNRLPNRAGKTFESFRRSQVNQRLPLENTWSRKRSAFAV